MHIKLIKLHFKHFRYFILFMLLIFFIVPNVDLSPICSPRFKPGPPSEQAQVLSENLNKLLKKYTYI